MSTCECGKPRARKGTGCQECNDLDHKRVERHGTRYRILTALRHLDEWTLAADLRAAMDMGEHKGMAVSAELGRLGRLVERGEIESVRVPGAGVAYRIARRRAA